MNVSRVDFESPHAAQEFAESLKTTGFAVLENHPIDASFVHGIYNEWVDFFNNSDKESLLFNKDTQDGFFPQSISETAKGATTKDIKEYFQYYPWGQYPEFISANTKKLYDQLNLLATTLLNWLEQELPKEVSEKLYTPLSQMIKESPQTMLRVLHYPPLTGDEPAGSIRAAAHEDINLLTLLVGATTPGLQVKDSHGEWLDVPCVQDSIVINVGDMLQLATQHYYVSTTHRVINPDLSNNESRLSMPFFLHARPEVRLSEDKTMIEYLTERLVELGVIDK